MLDASLACDEAGRRNVRCLITYMFFRCLTTAFWKPRIGAVGWRTKHGSLQWGPALARRGQQVSFFFYYNFSFHIGLASDDVRKLSNAWQRGKLVLNKLAAPHTKACWEKSLSLGEALYFFVERSERFWQLLHCLVHHISKDSGDRTSAEPFFGRSTIFQHAFVWDAIFV